MITSFLCQKATNWKQGNYRLFTIRSILCQIASKETSKSKMKQLHSMYDIVILVSESLQTDIEIGKKQLRTVSNNVILVSGSLQTDIEIQKTN